MVSEKKPAAGTRFRTGRISLLLATLVIAGIAIRAAFFWNSASNIPTSADESMMMLLAKGLGEDSSSPTFHAKQAPRFAFGRFPLLFVSVPYCLPVEAYMMAPVERLLPPNAFGSRALLFTLGLLMVALSLLVLRKSGGLGQLWPAAILVLFPSSYVLVFQAGYALPGYYSFLFLASAVSLLVVLHSKGSRRPGLLAAAAGFLAGIACCDTLMAIPVLVAAGVVVASGRRWKGTAVSVLSFLLGAGIGLGPYFAAKYLYPGAYAVVSARLPLAEALGRLWDPALNFTVPTVLGIRCPIFPDAEEAFSLVPWMVQASGAIWFVFLLSATGVCLWGFGRRLFRERRIAFGPLDLFMAMSWMCLMLFVLNARSHLFTYRYMLLLGWCFPFLAGYLFMASGRLFRVIIAVLAILLATVNVATTWSLGTRWAGKDFATAKLYLHDVGPLIAHLEARGIKRCYATNWNSYRINFASDERVVCSAPYNELFGDWPMPYVDLVDASTNVAVVLSSGFRFFPSDFERDLKSMKIRCRIEQCGAFKVYSDFESDAMAGEKMMPASALEMTASHCPDEAGALKDGNSQLRWRARKVQESGMYVEIKFRERIPVSRVSFYYDGYPYDMAGSLNVLARDDAGGWKPVASNIAGALDPFDFRNGHPVFSRLVQTIRFNTVETDALRVEIARPNEGRDWTVGEVEVYQSSSTEGDTPRQ